MVNSPDLTHAAKVVVTKKAMHKAAQSLTALIWNVSSPSPHRGKTGGFK